MGTYPSSMTKITKFGAWLRQSILSTPLGNGKGIYLLWEYPVTYVSYPRKCPDTYPSIRQNQLSEYSGTIIIPEKILGVHTRVFIKQVSIPGYSKVHRLPSTSLDAIPHVGHIRICII